MAKALRAQVTTLNGRRCLVPVERANRLASETAALADGTSILFRSAFCAGSPPRI